jgi:hypothetical protein
MNAGYITIDQADSITTLQKVALGTGQLLIDVSNGSDDIERPMREALITLGEGLRDSAARSLSLAGESPV